MNDLVRGCQPRPWVDVSLEVWKGAGEHILETWGSLKGQLHELAIKISILFLAQGNPGDTLEFE
jgi:hypothetical protein